MTLRLFFKIAHCSLFSHSVFETVSISLSKFTSSTGLFSHSLLPTRRNLVSFLSTSHFHSSFYHFNSRLPQSAKLFHFSPIFLFPFLHSASLITYCLAFSVCPHNFSIINFPPPWSYFVIYIRFQTLLHRKSYVLLLSQFPDFLFTTFFSISSHPVSLLSSAVIFHFLDLDCFFAITFSMLFPLCSPRSFSVASSRLPRISFFTDFPSQFQFPSGGLFEFLLLFINYYFSLS